MEALAPRIINVVRLIVQMGSAVAEQAANKGVRVAGGIREGRPRCGRNKEGRPRCGRKKKLRSSAVFRLKCAPPPLHDQIISAGNR